MDSSRVLQITRLFADRRLSRRLAVTGSAAALAAGTMVAHQTAAQPSTPVASPTPPPSGEKTTYLFVQSFQAGSLDPNADGETHTLTLEQGLGQTLYFGDRPSRDVGVSPTETF
ncbi:MAG: hypothetical protein ACTHQE_16555, partial [Thermomicrobiales bacterium]